MTLADSKFRRVAKPDRPERWRERDRVKKPCACGGVANLQRADVCAVLVRGCGTAAIMEARMTPSAARPRPVPLRRDAPKRGTPILPRLHDQRPKLTASDLRSRPQDGVDVDNTRAPKREVFVRRVETVRYF